MGFSVVSVEYRQINFYGVERLEDAVVAHGIRRLMDRIAEMPRQVWGTLPWSAQWAEDWATSCRWRSEDAQSAHDYELDTGNKVLQALADYTHTDVSAATSFDLFAPGLSAYLLPIETTDRQLGTYKPGGGFRYSDTPAPGTYGPFLEPRGNPQLDGVYEGHCPQETDSLSNFMADYGALIKEIDDAMERWGLGGVRLHRDYLEPARQAVPSVIDQFAEEALKAANGWYELSGNLKRDNKSLGDAWKGDAGAAAQVHGSILADYLDRCYTDAKWLGESGKQCAVTLRNIRTNFAQIGYARIPQIIDAYREFNQWWSDWSNLFFHLSGGKYADGGNDLVKAVSDAANAMGTVIANQAKTAGAVLQVEVTANGMPDLGTAEHEHVQPARNDAPGADAWSNPADW